MRLSRNGLVLAMNKRHNTDGVHKDRRSKRTNNPKRSWENEEQSMNKKAKKRSQHTVWGHHDTMIVNLRDWVVREINNLRDDITENTPKLCSSTSKILKNAEDLNVQMFDLIRTVADMAEKEATKSTPVSETHQLPQESCP